MCCGTKFNKRTVILRNRLGHIILCVTPFDYIISKKYQEGKILSVVWSKTVHFTDLIIAEIFMKKNILNKKIFDKKIKLFAMDVDGVLTDGGMYYSIEGEVLKKFNTKDGMGIELLRKNNIIPVIISKEDSKIVLRRAEKLKIKEVYIGIKDKLNIIEKLKEKYNLKYENIAYIGDDINDLLVLKKVGLSFAPNDALPEIKQIVDHITFKKGGKGAVREAIELILSRG